MASSQVVSLRLSLEELEYVQQQQLEGESLSMTLKRLLFGDNQHQPKQNSVTADESTQSKEALKTEIIDAVIEFFQPIADAVQEDREKLCRLANTVNDILEIVKPADIVNTVNTVNSKQNDFGFKDMTKAQLKRILDESGIKYNARASRDELIKLCLTKK